jgi:nitrite reductase/ring-hydroxylating ferredoxin subunit
MTRKYFFMRGVIVLTESKIRFLIYLYQMKIRLALFFLFTIISCKDKNETVPNTFVDIFIYTNNPEYVRLNSPGGWVYVQGGLKGIIVYRSSNDEFKAYERSCPYQVEKACQTVVTSDNVTIADTSCCGSNFNISDGGVSKGPASQGLRQYQTTFGNGVLHIYNF